jgi:flagellar hook protein FlgE
MKKYLTYLIAALLLVSCNKEDETVLINEPQNEALVLGLWYGNKSLTQVYDSKGVLLSSKEENDEDATFEFLDDRTFVSKAPGFTPWHGTWDLNNNEDSFYFDGHPFLIDILDSSFFEFISDVDTVVNNIEYTIHTRVRLKR